VIHERRCTCQCTVHRFNWNVIICFVLLFSCIALNCTLQCTNVQYEHKISTTHKNKKLPLQLVILTIHGNVIDRIHDTFDIVRDNSDYHVKTKQVHHVSMNSNKVSAVHQMYSILYVLYCTVLVYTL
jgi:hypothetical protein